MLTPEEFEERARAAFASIPPQFRARVDGPVVSRPAVHDPHVPGRYTLGECIHHPDWTGESPLASTVVLHYGSFRELARRDPHFDVDAEIRETVLHEVQHHVEDAAGHPGLRDLDWAEEQNDRRVEGLPHAPSFWRAGVALERSVWRVGDDVFVELALGPRELERGRTEGLEVTVGDGVWRLEPEDFGASGEGPATVVLDWEWELAPRDWHDAAPGCHAHGDTYGDLVVVLRPVSRAAALFGMRTRS